MFKPIKAREQMVCSYCGKPIYIGNYYEKYRQKNYHIPCIWDSILNDKKEDSLDTATKFFLSLQQYIGNWPAYDFDTEEDYLSDLELYKHNSRTIPSLLKKRTDKMTSIHELNEKFASLLASMTEENELEALTKRFNKTKSKIASYIKDIQADDIQKLDDAIKLIKDLKSAGEHIVDSRHDNDANKIERQIKKASDRLDAIEGNLK